ncbi:hypothetical protein RGQ21_67250 [Kitasatospora aureofaciens]|nr:hypothetical protein RGQ21_67250 [Kitasatospora aureofaciens]
MSVTLDKDLPLSMQGLTKGPLPDWFPEGMFRPPLSPEWDHWLSRNDMDELWSFFLHHGR